MQTANAEGVSSQCFLLVKKISNIFNCGGGNLLFLVDSTNILVAQEDIVKPCEMLPKSYIHVTIELLIG